MGAGDTIIELLDRAPFVPIGVLTTAGESYVVRNPRTVALLKSEVFIAHPDSDRRNYVPFLHISAVDTLANGRPGRSRCKR
ncbi:MAG: hypothetical protein HUU22_05550 [Phycisphaerae bacterium]|nr:hypothetical protein [Phycisphaerae bacterium]NUQ45478.1 hypothetical protein [Phycisphaerae bacterium]